MRHSYRCSNLGSSWCDYFCLIPWSICRLYPVKDEELWKWPKMLCLMDENSNCNLSTTTGRDLDFDLMQVLRSSLVKKVTTSVSFLKTFYCLILPEFVQFLRRLPAEKRSFSYLLYL